MFGLFLRIIFLMEGVMYSFPIFVSSLSDIKGGYSSSVYIIPIIGSIALILFLSRLGRETLLKFLPFIALGIAFQTPMGTFINYTCAGLSLFLFLFNAIRPWRA